MKALRHIREFWDGLSTQTKLVQVFNVFWLPFWFFVYVPLRFLLPVLFGIVIVNFVAARLICKYFGWFE